MTEKEQDKRHISNLLEIMARLRSPDGGCVWDLEQTFESIAPYTLEEAYEVVDAITREDIDDLRDELGDLLLQVVYHARMAEEKGAFDFGDVVEGICDKMVRRHPNVFGTDRVDTAEGQTRAWERIKAMERSAAQAETQDGGAATGATADSGTSAGSGAAADSDTTAGLDATANSVSAEIGALDGVAVALPALQRSTKLTERAARVGFDWPDIATVREKVDEELAELDEACAVGNPAHMAEEMGDLLFSLVNLCRHLKLDPERCLREANAKFETRFRRMEGLVHAQQRDWAGYDIQALEELWQEAKRAG